MKDYKYADCKMTYFNGLQKWVAFDWEGQRVYQAGEHDGLRKLMDTLRSMKLKGKGPWKK